jgi:hypothetical protein
MLNATSPTATIAIIVESKVKPIDFCEPPSTPLLLLPSFEVEVD